VDSPQCWKRDSLSSTTARRCSSPHIQPRVRMTRYIPCSSIRFISHHLFSDSECTIKPNYEAMKNYIEDNSIRLRRYLLLKHFPSRPAKPSGALLCVVCVCENKGGRVEECAPRFPELTQIRRVLRTASLSKCRRSLLSVILDRCKWKKVSEVTVNRFACTARPTTKQSSRERNRQQALAKV
jgi:hypothetical protein